MGMAQERETLFGEIVARGMRLNRFGLVAQREWERSSKRFPAIYFAAEIPMVSPSSTRPSLTDMV